MTRLRARSVSPAWYTGPLPSGSPISDRPNMLGANKTSANADSVICRVKRRSPRSGPVTGLQAALAGWYLDSTTGETPELSSYQAAVAIEYPVDAARQSIRWAGQAQPVIDPSHLIHFSDPLQLTTPIPPDTDYWVWCWRKWSGAPYNEGAACNATAGDTARRGTAIPDVTAAGAFVDAASRTWFPLALFSIEARYARTVAVFGDTVVADNAETNTSVNGWRGIAARGLKNQTGVLHLSRSNMGLQKLYDAPAVRNLVLRYATHFFCEVVHLEILDARPIDEIKAVARAAWRPYLTAGLKIYSCIPCPKTLPDYVTPDTLDVEISRLAARDWLRAHWAEEGLSGVMDLAALGERAGNPSAWNVTPQAWTDDFVHFNTYGHDQAEAAGLCAPAVFA